MDLIDIRRQLHAHPELGFDEFWTSNFIAEKLESLGLDVTKNFARTGLVAVIPGKDRTRAVAYRADIDALPIEEKTDCAWKSQNGCMHACGHDAHITVALGVAEELANASEKPDCDVVMVFQPNEEGAPGELPSGAALMCEEGLLELFHIQKMVALHCDPSLQTGRLGVCGGALWAASGRFQVSIQGKSAHAAYPDRGVDALWAASLMVSSIYSALQRCRPAGTEVVSICKLNAGTAFNVIAGDAAFEGIMRAPSRKHLTELAAISANTVAGVADFTHVQAKTNIYYGADAVINDETMADLALKTWKKLAVPVKMTMASEDFSHFSTRIPCFYAMLGICPPNTVLPPLHSDHFTLDEDAIPFAVQ
ncbi:MAG: amidohydrolase, partial [Proteobacteria bacterium]|nr:amidohydrolase [Pseudomonadota bacterium]